MRALAAVAAAPVDRPGADRPDQRGAPGQGAEAGPVRLAEEELLAVAELGVEEGVIEEDERALIESIIEFGDTVVREVMVPRPDMVTVGAASGWPT